MFARARGVGLILGIALLAVALAPAASEAPDPKKALAQEQIGVARGALSLLEELRKQGKVRAYDPQYSVWERRQIEAVRDAGANRAEFIAALEAYVKRMKDRQQLVDQAYQMAEVSYMDVLEAKYRILEAEVWLNQEKAR